MKRRLSAYLDVLRALVSGAEVDRESNRAWHDALRRCGVDNVVETRIALLQPRRLDGVRVPFTVRVTPLGAGASLAAIVRVGGMPAVISLRHESIKTSAQRMVGATEHVLGDPEFDRAFFVVGDPVVVRGIFDAATRARALRLFGRARSGVNELLVGDDGLVGMADGGLVAQFEDRRYDLTPWSFLADALALAERTTDEGAEERLGEVARTDLQPAVRRGALEALRDHRPGHAATVAALETACQERDSRVRLMAATALGVGKGRETLLDLATAPDVPDEVSAAAITELRSHLPAERALTVLDRALVAWRHLSAAACLDSLSRLGAHGDVASRVLWEATEVSVRAAAAHALRRCGSPTHVERLLAVAAASRSRPLAEACRSAVAAIQSRQLGASAGQVSIADDGGRVSLADDEAGRVSLGAGQPAGPRDDS